ncbi:hypothetical protein [Longibaculum muris]|uniref:hypothetical protein n=1 Tax=Longibaculum muris TaxID=1796628 RepID=UPI0029432EA8|nr:hypothetical protein [Longibaculum muris]
MKERIGIHFGVAFVYCVITRNLLGNGYLYTTTMTSFQKSLIYCVLIALFLTILLEMWNVILEIIVHKVNPLKFMILLCVVYGVVMFLLHSLYYLLIFGFLLLYICQDCWRMHVMNKALIK